MEIANSGNYKILSKGKIINLAICLEKWEGIAAAMSHDDGGKYEDTLINSTTFTQIQADYIRIRACLAKLSSILPFVDTPTINILNDLGYRIRKDSPEIYFECLEAAHRKSNGLLNKLRSLEVTINKGMSSGESKKLVLGEMISAVNVTLGSAYVDQFTNMELYNNYKNIARKKVEAQNNKKHG